MELREAPPNPELKKEWEESDKRVEAINRRLEQAAREMAEVWANAYLKGGEEAAKEALTEHLRQVEANKTLEEREEDRIIQERQKRWRRKQQTSPTSPSETE